MGSFWNVSCAFRLKKSVFRCLVYEAAVSEWTAAAPTQTDTSCLDSALIRYGRCVLAGRACKKRLSQSGDPVGFRALTNDSVFRYLDCVPTSLALRVRRLKWLQNIVRDPFGHASLIATLFGTFQFDHVKSVD